MQLPIIILLSTLFSLILVAAIIVSIVKEQKTKKDLFDNDQIDVPQSIIYRAMKQARNILVNAELTCIKEIARSKHDTHKLEDEFEAHLTELTNQSAQHLELTGALIEKHYIDLFKKTEAFVTNQIKDNQQRIINQLDLATREAEKTINTQAAAAREELDKRMEMEFAGAKQLIREYKNKQMELIDRDIVSIVENTIKKTLGLSLTKKDHADLVIQALGQAKQEGFFSETAHDETRKQPTA